MSRRFFPILGAALLLCALLLGSGPATGPAEARPDARLPVDTSPGTSGAVAVPTATPGPAPPADPAWAHLGNKVGVQLMLADGGDLWSDYVWYHHVRYARQLVGDGGWVVEVVPLEDMTDPLRVARWQYFLDLCAEEQLVPVLRLATTYDHQHQYWIAPPTDADGRGYRDLGALYATFIASLRWPTSNHDVVLANEPNRGDEWGNAPDPAAYARFVVDVGAALHAVGATVLGPTLDTYAPNSRGQLLDGVRYVDAETFLLGMAAADPRSLATFDVWAAHAYPLDPFREDPSKQTFRIDDLDPTAIHRTPPPGIYNRGVNSYDWELWLAAPYLGARAATIPVLITETGWRHTSSAASPGDATHAEITSDLLATYVDLAFNGNHGRYPSLPSTGWTPWDDDPRVLGAALFALDGDPRYWSHSDFIDVDIWGNVVGVDPAFNAIRKWAG
jgi:hypothetical protein